MNEKIVIACGRRNYEIKKLSFQIAATQNPHISYFNAFPR